MPSRRAKLCRSCRAGTGRRTRRGLTLAELLVATTIMLMIARAVAAATANEKFPGCIVVTEQAGGEQLPSTLVVWSPTGTPANLTGLPLVSEIVVYSANPTHPNELLEIRSPTDNTSVPATTDAANWRTLTDNLKTSASTVKVVLTTRLRTAPLSGSYSDSLAAADLRGVVRFRRLMAPTDQDWAQYRAGTRNWQDLNWPLDSYRSTSGTRAVACQTELQIAPGSMASAAVTAIPFYGSASITYELPR